MLASPGVEISFRLTVGVALSGHSQACKLQDPQVALRSGPSQVPKSNTSGHHGQSLIGVDAEMNLAGIQSPVGASALCEDLFQKLSPNGPMAAFDKERLLVFLAHWNIVIYHEGGPLSFAGVVHANLIPSIWRDAFALEQLLVRVEIFHEKVTSFTSFPWRKNVKERNHVKWYGILCSEVVSRWSTCNAWMLLCILDTVVNGNPMKTSELFDFLKPLNYFWNRQHRKNPPETSTLPRSGLPRSRTFWSSFKAYHCCKKMIEIESQNARCSTASHSTSPPWCTLDSRQGQRYWRSTSSLPSHLETNQMARRHWRSPDFRRSLKVSSMWRRPHQGWDRKILKLNKVERNDGATCTPCAN